jgi:hypothetical protein
MRPHTAMCHRGTRTRLRAWKGSGATMCPRLWIPPLYLGGLQRCHVPRGSAPLTIREGSDATTCPSALDPALPLRSDPALTRVLQLQTAPTSMVGSGVDMCPKALRGPWAIEIKEGLAAMACGEACVFLRHACALPRHLQDMWADSVMMTYKPRGQALQHCATVQFHTNNHSQAWHYSAAPCY